MTAEAFEKLTPAHFDNGETFDAEAFASLKEALPKQKRNTVILTVAAIFMAVLSLILALAVGGAPILPCWLVFLILVFSLNVKKWNRQVGKAKETLKISGKDLKTAIRKLKDEEEEKLLEQLSVSFNFRNDLDKNRFGSLVNAIRKRGKRFWVLPLIAFVVLPLGNGIIMSILKESLDADFFSVTFHRISLFGGMLLALLAGYFSQMRLSRRIQSAASTLEISPSKLAKAIYSRKSKPNRSWLILAIAAYLTVFIMFLGMMPGLIFVLTAIGITGVCLLARKKRYAVGLIAAPIILLVVTALMTQNKNDYISFTISASFFILPCIPVRYFMLRNGLNRSYGKPGKFAFFGVCILLLVASVYQWPDNIYRYVGWERYGMRPVRATNGKWGSIDRDGKETIPCIYDEKFFFKPEADNSQGEHKDRLTAFVSLDGKWGVIDGYGTQRTPFMYDEINAEGSPNRLFPAKLNGLWGYIDLSGKEIIPFRYDEANPFIKDNTVTRVKLNSQWGVIDTLGNEIIPCMYDELKKQPNRFEAKKRDGQTFRITYFDMQGVPLPDNPDATLQTTVIENAAVEKTTLRIDNYDRTANRFDFIDTQTEKKLTYRKLVINGQTVHSTECILNENTEMVKFVVKEKESVGTRQEGGKTVQIYSGESSISFSVGYEMRYKLENEVLTIFK
ncbi:MAG: WG repeat-containing protein [Bacteroidales bacterium]|jgi:hypothetical protein|nr:WG repeat-containing protein [Bacteroidales bacterium]